MRILLVLVALALAAPHARAGEFIARQPKAQPAAPAAKAKSKAKPVRKITRTAAKPKKGKKKSDGAWKRPMP